MKGPKKELEKQLWLMETYITVNGQMINLKDMEIILFCQETIIQVNSKRARGMERGHILTKIKISTTETG